MALKRFTTAEMVQLSSAWVGDGPARQALLGVSLLAPLVPVLTAAHEALVQLQPGQREGQLAPLAEQAAALDAEHDGLVRGLFTLLSGCAELEPQSPAQAALELLFPEGVSVVKASYAGEAGAAALLAQRLATASEPRSWLERASVGAGPRTAFSYVEQLLRVARELGEVEARRHQLLENTGPTGAELSRARSRWMGAVNALLSTAELAGLSVEADQLLFGPLRRLEQMASRRRRSSSAAESDAAVTTESAPTP